MINNIDDRIIVNLTRKGDSSAYLLLYDTYAPLLYGIIYRITKDKAKAESVLEQTILKIWQNRIAGGLDKVGFSVWMINIARSFARNENGKNEAKDDDSLTGSGILELVITKELNIKQAANCLRITVSEALIKLRTELKQSTPIKN